MTFLSSGGMGTPYVSIRSTMTCQPARSWRCWATSSRLWQMMQRAATSSTCRPAGSGPIGPGGLGAPEHTTPRRSPTTSAAPCGRSRLGHIHPHGVDHVPAIALGIVRATRRLEPTQRAAGARHDGVRAALGVPPQLPAAPRIAVLLASELGCRPALTAVGRDVHGRDRALAAPREAEQGVRACRHLRPVQWTDDDRLALEGLKRVGLLRILGARGAVAALHERAVPLLVGQREAGQPLDRGRADP